MEDKKNEKFRQFEIHEGIVFLIHLTKSIFTPLKELNNKSQFVEIMESINSLMNELIITLPNTGIGVYFYNCQTTDSKFGKECGLTKLFRLNDLNSYNMKRLNDVINDDLNGIKHLQDRYPPNEEMNSRKSLPTVLNIMLDELLRNRYYNTRKLIWFTNDDRPYTDEQTKGVLWKIINDFDENMVQIRPFFLDSFSGEDEKNKHVFNPALFQNIFLNTNYLNRTRKETMEGADSLVESQTQGVKSNTYYDLVFDGLSKNSKNISQSTLPTQIKRSILRLKEIRRIVFSCDLILSDGEGVSGRLGCSVRGYALFQPEKLKKFRKIYNNGDVLKLVHTNTKRFKEGSGQEISQTNKEGQDLDNNDDNDADNEENETYFSKNVRKGIYLGNGRVLLLDSGRISFLKNYAFDHEPSVGYPESTSEANDNENFSDDTVEDDVPFSRPPYLKLLFFRHVSKFHECFTSSSPVFVTPDMSNAFATSSSYGGFSNSFRTFASLYESCKKLQRFAILFGCLKKNALPSLFALYPTRIERSSKPFFDFPEGFFLVRLPWLEDVRGLPDYALKDMTTYNDLKDDSVSSTLVKDYIQLASDFPFEYRPSRCPNPSLNFFYKIVSKELVQEELSPDERSLISNDVTARRMQNIHNHIQENKEKRELIRNIHLHLLDIEDTRNKRSNTASEKFPQKKIKQGRRKPE